MRKKKFLSPSALACYEAAPVEFFYRYLCDIRTPRDPQQEAMAVGSAFDALVKNFLARHFWGDAKTEERGYTLRELVTSQVEEHQLPDMLALACELFEQYRVCGSLGALLSDLEGSRDLDMEFDVTATVGGVPLLGKPDLHYVSRCDITVIADFKVNGAVSKTGASPQVGYAICRDEQLSRTHGKAHAKFVPRDMGDFVVNLTPMNETTSYWADQLTTYAWCLGFEVGSVEWAARIEQIACRPPGKRCPWVRAKCATHLATVSPTYQHELLDRYKACWEAMETGKLFPNMTAEESAAYCDLLTRSLTTRQVQQAEVAPPSATEIGDWF